MEKYSVLMSVYSKEKPEYLQQSIASIMHQTVPADEFLIVCDGKLTNELDCVLDKYEKEFPDIFHILRLKENVGLGRALNKGLEYCSHSIVARMDSDDISCPDRCEKQLQIIEQGVDIVSGTVLEFEGRISNQTSKRMLPITHEEIIKFVKRRNPFNHPCVMYRKEMVKQAGGYQHFYLFEDYYLWARMLMAGAKGRNLEDVVLYMRAGSGMYKRRGGMKYVKSMLKFRYFLMKSGVSGINDFIITTGGQIIVCLIPNKLREVFYKKYLRK